MITLDSQVEDLLAKPGVMTFFIERGYSPFSCSGAFPDTVGRFLAIKGVPDPEGFIRELNAFLGLFVL
jgi:hypothetical protein